MVAPWNGPSIESVAPAAWRDIERLVDETMTLAREAASPLAFYEGLLRRTVPAARAVGGAVWTPGAAGAFSLLCQADAPDPWRTDRGCQSLAELLSQAARSERPLRAPLRRRRDASAGDENAAEAFLLLCPVVVDGEACSVVGLWENQVSAGASAAERVLEAVCELASEFHRRRQIAQLRQWQADAAWIEEFSQAVHGRLDLGAVAFAIANEGRRLLGWDRVSVLIRRGPRYRICAISGVDSVDRRANLVQSLERFTRTALAAGEPVWCGDAAPDLPPEAERALQEFLDESHARRLAALPLRAPRGDGRDPQPVIGALVLERFTAEADLAADARRAETAARHGAAALRNALEHRDLPGFWLADRLARMRWLTRARQLPLVLLAALCVAALASALAFVPTAFRVEAHGALQPDVRRDVFAPADGVVQRVAVDHAQQVAAGQLLVELRQSELDFEFTRVLGELQTARKQLDAVQATRLQPQRSSDAADQDQDRLTAQEEELKKLVEGLEEQRKILLAQKAELRVFSPISGQVLSWEVRRNLEARPVQRGQLLMTVADPRGSWILELRVPDDDMGYVLAAQRTHGQDLPVSFLLATDPATEHRGEVARVALAPETDERHQATVLVTVRVPGGQLSQPRPGASVLAKIDCGRRSWGFVWFHDLLEAVRKHLLF